MSRKYSRILQAAALTQELEKYQAYLTGKTDRQPNIGKRGNRPARTNLFITPFTLSFPQTIFLQCSGSTAAYTDYEAAIGAHAKSVLPQGDESIKVKGFRPAKINIITGKTTQGEVKISHITGAKYLYYGGKSVSLPFGKSATTDTEDTVFQAIKAQITGGVKYLIPEKP